MCPCAVCQQLGGKKEIFYLVSEKEAEFSGRVDQKTNAFKVHIVEDWG